jgi:hypothetical protein
LPGNALKVPVVVGGGGWVVESKLSDQLWLSFSLALAKLNNLCHVDFRHAQKTKTTTNKTKTIWMVV